MHAVAFSPSGDALAFASHDSSITVVYPSGPDTAPQAIYSVRVPSLPFLSVLFLSETSLVAAGHDYEPILFSGDVSSGWQISKSLDDPSNRAASGPKVRAGGLRGNEAFAMFQNADSRGVKSAPAIPGGGAAVGSSNAAKAGGERNTAHQNTITSLRAYEGEGSGQITKISSSGLDGKVIVWNTSDITSGVGKMSIR